MVAGGKAAARRNFNNTFPTRGGANLQEKGAQGTLEHTTQRSATTRAHTHIGDEDCMVAGTNRTTTRSN